MKLLGIDYGTKYVGVATADSATGIVFPKTVVSNSPSLVQEMCVIAKEIRAEAIVLGASTQLSGRDNPISETIQHFGNAFSRESGLPLYFAKEHFTTKEAKRFLEETEVKNKRADASAAALILEWFISTQKHDDTN